MPIQPPIQEYLDHGWKLCKIRAGGKHPDYTGWNVESAAVTAEGFDRWEAGVGLLHAYSGTCAIDIDALSRAQPALLAHGINLLDLIRAPDAVVMTRGHKDKAKLFYALTGPFDSPDAFETIKCSDQGFEFRCRTFHGTSSAQDVLPPSEHPAGAFASLHYSWAKGDWRRLPQLPESLRNIWPRLKKLYPQHPMASGAVSATKAAGASSLTAAAMVESLDDVVPEGARDDTVSKFAFKHHGFGLEGDALYAKVMEFNLTHCDPPLSDSAIERICRGKESLPVDSIKDEVGVPMEYPALPEGYKWQGQWVMGENGVDATGAPKWEVVFDRPIYVTAVSSESFDGREQREVQVTDHSATGIKAYPINMDDLVSKTEIYFLKKGLNLIGTARIARAKNYFIRGKEMIEKSGALACTYNHFGWQEDGTFLMGTRLIRPKAAPLTVPVAGVLSDEARCMVVRGTLHEWRGAVSSAFMKPEYEAQAFALLMGFAAPLMYLCDERGGLYSMVGASGQGKSMAQEAIATIYGRIEGFRSRADDTENARMIMLSRLCNLPMVAEELTKLAPSAIGALAYAVSEGRDKRRATREGGLQQASGTWNTLVVSSSNRSLLQILLTTDATPEAYRVLEDDIKLPAKADWNQGKADMRTMVANCGTAGMRFVQYVVDNADTLRAKLDATRRHLSDTMRADTKGRIRIGMVACAVVAAEVLNAADILAVDVARFTVYGRKLLSKNASAHESQASSSLDVLGDFLNLHTPSALRFTGAVCMNEDRRNTNHALTMRYQTTTGIAAVAVPALRAYAMVRRMPSWEEFWQELVVAGVIPSYSPRRVNLTNGTDLPDYSPLVLSVDTQALSVACGCALNLMADATDRTASLVEQGQSLH